MDPNGNVIDLDITDFSIGIHKKIKKRTIKNILEYPPSNYDQLKYSILEYLKSKYFNFPISLNLFQSNFLSINENFKLFRQIIQNLDISKVMIEL